MQCGNRCVSWRSNWLLKGCEMKYWFVDTRRVICFGSTYMGYSIGESLNKSAQYHKSLTC